jgi:arylsulfatase A-like enzyme
LTVRRPGVRVALAACAAVLAVILSTCHREAAAPTEDAASWRASQVVLVTFDALRPDRMSLYGHDRLTTPEIDALTRGGVVFEGALSASSYTYPSLASVFTATYPRTHGAYDAGIAVRTGVPFLVPRLAQDGIRTACIVTNDLPNQGTTEAFAERDVRPGASATEITDRALDWTARHAAVRYFLWIHYFEPHDPYDAPADVSVPPVPGATPRLAFARCPRDPVLRPGSVPAIYPRDGATDTATYLDRYDRRIRYADREFGRLVAALRKGPASTPPTVIVAADHGEAFGEHAARRGGVGEFQHGGAVHEERVRVPLVLVPGEALPAPRRIGEPVSLVDLMPTVFDLFGIAPRPRIDGVSLLPLVRGERHAHRLLISEAKETGGAGYAAARYGSQEIFWEGAARTFVHFDLATDPCEANAHPVTPDAADLAPEVAVAARRLAEYLSVPVPATEPALSAAQRERLKAMGYIR